MICEKCGEICYLIDVEFIFSSFGLFRHRHAYGLSGVQGLKKTFKCIKCGTEIQEGPKKKAEGYFVDEGDMRVWKPGKRPAEGVR